MLLAANLFEGAFVLVVSFLLMMMLCQAIMIIRCWRRIPPGKAIIITGASEPSVHFCKAIVLPLVRQEQWVDISAKRIEVALEDSQALLLKDKTRCDIRVTFIIRIGPTSEEVLQATQWAGVKEAGDEERLTSLFSPVFSQAMQTAGSQAVFAQLESSQEEFIAELRSAIKEDLHGYRLDHVSITYARTN